LPSPTKHFTDAFVPFEDTSPKEFTMNVRSNVRLATAAALAILLGACSSAPVSGSPVSGSKATAVATAAPEVAVAGDIPDSQAFVAYASPDGYSIKVPEGWARSTDGAATVFTDKFNTIRIETTAASTAPTVDSVKTDLAPVAASSKGYAAGKITALSRKAGTVIVASYMQDSAPNAVTSKTIRLDVERYAFWKAGKAAVVTLSSAAGSDNVDPWKIVTDGFSWT
jgi:hypothetical protein